MPLGGYEVRGPSGLRGPPFKFKFVLGLGLCEDVRTIVFILAKLLAAKKKDRIALRVVEESYLVVVEELVEIGNVPILEFDGSGKNGLEEKHDAFKAKFDKDRASIEAEYCQSCQPLYVERYNIINGETYEDNIDHEAEGESMDHETDETSSDSEEEKALLAYEKEVPNFWLYALQNNDYIDDEITYRDELALEFLKDIKCSPIDCFKGFKLDFYFRANPFFENSVLTKTYFMSDEDRSIVKDITGTKIKWYPTRCLTQIPIRKTPETGSEFERSIATFEDYDSFFSFFNALEVDDIDKRIEQMQHDFTIGSIIRHQIIPQAVSWLTGEAIEKDVCSDDEDQYLGLEYKFEDIDECQDAP
ncbi:hypothetical protein ACLB2K_017585 [Fragaria x ananassa]